MNLPLVLTIGEPAGIGPEITVKAKKHLADSIPFFVIGDFDLIRDYAQSVGVKTRSIIDPAEVFEEDLCLCVMDHKLTKSVSIGKPDLRNATAVRSSIEWAVELINVKKASGLVTCPINKWVLRKGASFNFEGHTDFLSHLDGQTKRAVMLLENRDGFRVTPVTIHVPLAEVPKLISQELITHNLLALTNHLMRDCSIKAPNILITGLNPHAGENGTLGQEENNIIKPAIESLKPLSFNISGPVSADSAFTRNNREAYDAFVSMYHDQALIPFKTLDFENGANITLGLSFVRTSPNHGTGLDIAGKNMANPASLIFAIREANRICNQRELNG